MNVRTQNCIQKDYLLQNRYVPDDSHYWGSGSYIREDLRIYTLILINDNRKKQTLLRYIYVYIYIYLNNVCFFLLSFINIKINIRKSSRMYLPELRQWRSSYIHIYMSMALYGAETWTLLATDQKGLESFEMWCWRRMEKISWTDHVRNEEVLLSANEQRNILPEIRKRKANWIGHILHRNCLVQQFTEGKIKGQIEVTRRGARRRKKLLDDLKDRRGYRQLKEEALDRTIWRNRFGRGFGPVV